MNFPHDFGNKFPLPPPPFMPWNMNPFTSFPFPPTLPNPSLFGPSNSHNPIYIEHQNNYFGLDRNDLMRTQFTNPFFQKLINSSDKNSKTQQVFPFGTSNKPIEIIEISDGETPKKVKGSKKKEVSKQKRICFQLKRLNNKKYTKALKKNDEYMEQEMKEFMQKVETQTKRITRVSGRIPKDINDDNDQFMQRERAMIYDKQQPQEQQQQIVQPQHKQESILDGIKFDTNVPQLSNAQQIQFWKKSIKQQLLLRKMPNQRN